MMPNEGEGKAEWAQNPNTSHPREADPASDPAPSQGDGEREVGAGQSGEEKTRVIFVPWAENTPQAEEWKQKSEQWNEARKDKHFEIVYYQEGVQADALVRATADRNGAVYIRGHGGPGAQGLLTKWGVTSFETLPMEEVCRRLTSMGLGEKFEGAVKFHSCYSGTVFTDQAYQTRQIVADERAAEREAAIKKDKAPLWYTLRSDKRTAIKENVNAQLASH